MLPQFENTEIAFKYRTTPELKQAQFLFSSMGSPTLTRIGMAVTKWAISWNLPINGPGKKDNIQTILWWRDYGRGCPNSQYPLRI